ncbi:4-hydroxy-tetrahydrodipicolinate synthase [Paraburkholderia sp. GAS448]|uniref:dihydrodipicolinate synthase family protein n=1 Tax=Paraburkholderia sp. GAS448 TaxID=3035136 RepID=UPI003D20ACD2
MTSTLTTHTHQPIRGLLAPVVTPFGYDLEVDTRAFIAHCRWLVDAGAGLAVFGTNSEAASLSFSERMSLLDTLIGAGLPAGKMMPGTGTSSLKETVELTRHAVNMGAAGVLMLPPYYFRNPSENGLFDYFSRVIDSVSDSRLRIYLYHIPQFTQVPITLTLIERLISRYPGVVRGAKDSSGDWANTESMIRTFGPDGFDVFPASEAFLARAVEIGGAGCISATANMNPRGLAELYTALISGEPTNTLAAALAIREIFTSVPMIPAMKYVISKITNTSTWSVVRPPLTSLADELGRDLMKRLNDVRFVMHGLNSWQPVLLH